MKPSRRKTIILSGAVLASLAGCLGRGADDSGVPAPDIEIGTDVDEATVERVVEGNTTFALDLLAELVAEEPTANHTVSPFSISVALAMLLAGAGDDIETEMADALRVPHEQDELHRAMGGLLEALHRRVLEANDSDDDERDGTLELAVANRLWPDENFELEDDFLETMQTNYAAEPEPLSYGDDPDAAREEINAWVADRTNEMIDDLFSNGDITRATEFVLTNAIYLQADWLKPFDPDDTTTEPFTAIDGREADVSMMNHDEEFPYAEVDGHQLVELPYVGNELHMIVLLPAAGEFESFERELDADRLAALLDERGTAEVDLSMPRFEIDGDYDLLETLSERLGIPTTGFDRIAPGLSLDTVQHKAVVTVDEEGTEAAAATGASALLSAPPSVSMTVDRPFYFLLRDQPTGSVLFLGRIVQPPDEP